MNPLYYECHVTIEPVFDSRLELFKEWSSLYGFKVAKLLMEKGPSTKDSFCTAHNTDFDELRNTMYAFTQVLRDQGFTVRRNKIEAVVLDERFPEVGN